MPGGVVTFNGDSNNDNVTLTQNPTQNNITSITVSWAGANPTSETFNNVSKFVFKGGTNFDPAVDAHFHEGTFNVKDKDTFEQTFTVPGLYGIQCTPHLAMGMVMLPPVIISLPFKILLFVLVDGWHLITESVIKGFF